MPTLQESVVRIKCGERGSGFIISSDSIVTVHHYLRGADAEDIRVEFYDSKEEYTPTKLEEYCSRDLAVLKLNCSGYAKLERRDFSNLQIGHKLLYAGYPHLTNEYEQRSSTVCALGRQPVPLLVKDFSGNVIEKRNGDVCNQIFFDVPNVKSVEGMSGGPVVNDYCEVIGVMKGFDTIRNKQMAISI